MKKKRLVCGLLLCLLLAFSVSCSAFSEKAILGRWLLSEESGSEQYEGELVLRFDEDGKLYAESRVGDKFPYSYVLGTYVVDGDELYIYCEGEQTVCTFSLKGDALTLQAEGDNITVLTRVEED